MVKLRFFVHCEGWKNGGYENIHYFHTEKEAKEWADKWADKIINIEAVSYADYMIDFMGGGY